MRFDCSVLYDPTYDLTVEWKKDNNDVNEDDPRITVDRASVGNQALTITDLTYDDAGKNREKPSVTKLFHNMSKTI